MIPQLDPRALLRWGFGILFGIGLFFILSPFLISLSMGVVLAIFLNPVQRKLENLGWNPSIAAGWVTVLFSLGFLIPLLILTVLGANSMLELFSSNSAFTTWLYNLRNDPSVALSQLGTQFQPVIDWASQVMPNVKERLASSFGDLMQFSGTRIADGGARFLQRVPGILLSVTIAIFGIYFFLRERRTLVALVKEKSFLGPAETETLMVACERACRAVIMATLVSGFFQSFLYSVGCLLLGIHGIALIAFLVFFTSFIPVVASLPVTGTIALAQILNGNTWVGLILSGLAILNYVGDSLIRPMILKGGAALHPFLAFLAALGGIQVFGVMGIFLGPVVAALALTLFRLFSQEWTTPLSTKSTGEALDS